jgi:hypothetical protein
MTRMNGITWMTLSGVFIKDTKMKVGKAVFQQRKIRESNKDTFDAIYKNCIIYISTDHGFGEPDDPDLKRFNMDVRTMDGGYLVESYEDHPTIEDAIESALKGAMLIPQE